MQSVKKLPSGIKLLRGPKKSEAVTVSVTEACCSRTPGGCDNCEYKEECRQIFDKRTDEWQPRKERSNASTYKEPTKEKKYCDWIPVLHSSDLRHFSRLRREQYLC
jgi:hypothetical protein